MKTFSLIATLFLTFFSVNSHAKNPFEKDRPVPSKHFRKLPKKPNSPIKNKPKKPIRS